MSTSSYHISLTVSLPVAASVFNSSPLLLSEGAEAIPTFNTIGGGENTVITGVLIRSVAVNVLVAIILHGSEGVERYRSHLYFLKS